MSTLFEYFDLDLSAMEENTNKKQKVEKKKEKKKENKKVVGEWDKEITLPIDIRHFDSVITLNPGDFNDKEVVTLETIRAKLEEQFPELEKGKCTLTYYENKNFLVPILKNGERKG